MQHLSLEDFDPHCRRSFQGSPRNQVQASNVMEKAGSKGQRRSPGREQNEREWRDAVKVKTTPARARSDFYDLEFSITAKDGMIQSRGVDLPCSQMGLMRGPSRAGSHLR